MQRLALAVLLLALIAGVLWLASAGVRAAVRPDGPLRAEGGVTLQKLAYAALFVLILGVSTGWLGGL